MAQTLNRPRLTLNTDGNRHPKENALAFATVILGVAAIATTLFPDLHAVSFWTGLVGLVVGLWGQMISVTTPQRFVYVIFATAAGLGAALGMAHGGPF